MNGLFLNVIGNNLTDEEPFDGFLMICFSFYFIFVIFITLFIFGNW